MEFLLSLTNLYFGWMLLVAGLGKMISLGAFRADLQQQAVVPRLSVPYVAGLVVLTEFGLGGLMLAGLETGTGAVLVLAFMISLTAYHLVARLRRSEEGCGCFGAAQSGWFGNSQQNVLSVALMAALAGLQLWLAGRWNPSAEVAPLLVTALIALPIIVGAVWLIRRERSWRWRPS